MRPLDRLPIRWRLALTSAVLTLAILLTFAVVMGLFTARHLRESFDDDLRATAADLQERVRVRSTVLGGVEPAFRPDAVQIAAAGGGALRVVTPDGELLAQTQGAPDLGPPVPGVRDAGDERVVSRPLFGGPLRPPAAYLQYAKPRKSLDKTIARIWVFLGVGVLGGTALALLAGLAVARRAMRPISSLTAAARSIAHTRDPGVALPRSGADDEVADLSRTLEEMLRALDSARSETEDSLARQREFVADASHELRTPLTSILANLELLEADLGGEDREIAGSALRSSRRMRRLVGDLLLLARADAGQRGARVATDLGALVRDAAAEASAASPGEAPAVDVPEGVVVEGVPDDLHRMARNLVENALAHTPPGTRVSVTLRREGETALLEVADDGPGIAPELRERIFERFVRGAGDRAAETGGTGLGLAIVRAVAAAHGGQVELASVERGTRFVVRIPVVSGPAGGTRRAAAQTA